MEMLWHMAHKPSVNFHEEIFQEKFPAAYAEYDEKRKKAAAERRKSR